MSKKVLIVGAGLSGLLTAYRLKNSGLNVKVIEARDRIGGRIHTKISDNQTPVDMGATWFWEENIRLKTLMDELNTQKFTQKMRGTALFEAFSTLPPQEVQVPTQPQSFRIIGGTINLLYQLAANLTDDELHLNQVVNMLDFSDEKVQVHTADSTHEADTVVITIPPALFAETVNVIPVLPAEFLQVAQKTHTWMKDSIKVAVTYDYPFWAEKGLSGTVYSNVGPITEFYDHVDARGEKFALCGFMNGGLSQFSRAEREQHVRTQLHKLFGNVGANFIAYEETLWMHEPFTALPTQEFLHAHQHNGHAVFQQPYFNGKLFIAGTETSSAFGGYMEGAVRAAERVVKRLIG